MGEERSFPKLRAPSILAVRPIVDAAYVRAKSTNKKDALEARRRAEVETLERGELELWLD